jgi:hypothetical protein
MKVVPIGAPQPQPQSSAATDARARAIAMLTGGNNQVQNQTAVTPEEIPAATPQAQQAAPAEAPAEPVAQEPTTPQTEEPRVSAKFAELAKREKAHRSKVMQQEQTLKAREEALAKREAELQARGQQPQEGLIPADRFKTDPIGVLNELGISYDDLTQAFLDNSQPQDQRIVSHIQKLEAEIKALKGQTEEREKQTVESQQKQYAAALQQLTRDTKALVETDPSFELIKATDSVKDVVELIEKEFNENGNLLSVQDAAKLVEEELLEQETKRLERISKLEKVQKRLKPVAPAQAATETKQQPAQGQQQQPVKTLTNAIASARKLSAKERAILAFKGEKPQ